MQNGSLYNRAQIWSPLYLIIPDFILNYRILNDSFLSCVMLQEKELSQ